MEDKRSSHAVHFNFLILMASAATCVSCHSSKINSKYLHFVSDL